jgi:integrase/recombinase XerD
MNDELNTFREKYRQHLVVIHYALETIKRYVYFLNRFFAWIEDQGITEVSKITKEIVLDYQAHLYEIINSRGEPNSVFHLNNTLKALKGFFRFLAEKNYSVSDPAKDISYARTPRRLPRSILTGPEAKKVIHAPDTKTASGYRDRTILEVLYSTGIRRSELLNLQLADVDYHDGFVRVNSGKGSKDRVVPIGKIACRYLENYVKAVRPMFVKDPTDNHLFLTVNGTRISKNRVWELVKVYGKKTKIKKNISPHTFRHTCATLMLRNKANIRHIQELLGHASLETTQVYTSVSIADLKEVHAKCHPREKDRD